MKRLIRYKCMIEKYLADAKGSFEIMYAEITAETKAEAMRMASTSVEINNFKRCKIEQSVIADPDAIKGVQWLMNNREV